MIVFNRASCSLATASCRELPCTISFASSESKNGNISVPVSTQVSTLAPAHLHMQLISTLPLVPLLREASTFHIP